MGDVRLKCCSTDALMTRAKDFYSSVELPISE
jgi:hypothetical protein